MSTNETIVGYWGMGLPHREALPARPALAFSQPSVSPALVKAVLTASVNIPGVARALRMLPAREVARWLLLAPTFAFHGVDRTMTWSGVELPVPRPLQRDVARRDAEPITALVIAQNESDRIVDALASIENVVDDIVVVDGGSIDDTVALAEAAGARVVRRPFDRFDFQRNAGLDHVRTPWTIKLDCDERVQSGAAVSVLKATTSSCKVISMNILNYVSTNPQPFVWPDGGPRLFRSNLRFKGQIHENPPQASVLRMPLDENHLVTWKSEANAVQNHITYTRMMDPDDPELPALEMQLATLDLTEDRNVPSHLWWS